MSEYTERIAKVLLKASGHYLGMHEAMKLAPIVERMIDAAADSVSSCCGCSMAGVVEQALHVEEHMAAPPTGITSVNAETSPPSRVRGETPPPPETWQRASLPGIKPRP